MGKQCFPAPKRGKRRAARKPTNKMQKKPPNHVPYVRHGKPTAKSRKDRSRWCRSLQDFLNKGEKHVIDTLKVDGILPEWKGVRCPWCSAGVLGPLTKGSQKSGSWHHRCNRGRTCGRRVAPHDFHPIFVHGKGQSTTPLDEQATMLFCALAGCSQAAALRILPKNHKAAEGIYARLHQTQARFVRYEEKKIKFGFGQGWEDVEADEVDLGKGEDPDAKPNSPTPIAWEQWGGIVQRGAPETLVLFRLDPAKAKRRAPGPGPIRKRDWLPKARKWLADRRVILHTDGAKTYKLKLHGVKHDFVVHKSKRIVVRGRPVWLKPKFAKVCWHNIAEEGRPKKQLWVQAGTQIIDRIWGLLRKDLGQTSRGPNSRTLETRIRAFQWAYWNRDNDLWQETGRMLQSLFVRDFSS